ncbi:sugar-binding transcriptional regulator [Actibacterium sp. 188UL27-1]|uniref:sugar-binding transcriptional regulator n=1 Tax=Actibacterium sp. 188UL27-1 TaxID=2786961 RepID=UPI00195A2560|nr:sugar-binding transcriptional regulator [Actibacterium sp. 188UL27-1]
MPRTAEDDGNSLVARAAWLHFCGGLTQTEVAKRLSVPSTKAHRLIAQATRDGMVQVFVEAEVTECTQLENQLLDKWGLTFCQVAPDLDEPGLPLRSLGMAGAGYLRMMLENRDVACIGIGHGRTLAAAVKDLPRLKNAKGMVVSLLGGLTRKFAANPFDVIHRIAEKTGLEAYMLPVPLYASRPADRDVLMAQIGVGEVFELGRTAELLVAGIGGVGELAHLRETSTVTPDEMAELEANGAVGEILGHYLNADGAPVISSLSGRVMSSPIDTLQGSNVVAIAGGTQKINAIRAVLKSGILKGLITDEVTAQHLV